MQWNLDVQQQFPGSVLLDLGYSGSRGEHLTGTFDRNTLDPRYLSLGNALTIQVTNPFRPYVGVGTLAGATVSRRQLLLPSTILSMQEVNNPYGASTYHSLQAKLVKRTSNGLTLLASYTWSKLISNVNAQDAPIGPSDCTGVQNYYDLRRSALSREIEQPQNFIFNAVYELPFGHGHRDFGNVPTPVDKMIGGWRIISIVTEQSGFPPTLTAPGVGAGTRPNLVPGFDPRIEGNRSKTSPEEHRRVTAAYYAVIEQVDTAVGEMLQTLEETGQADDTIVIFMSDHVEMLGDHGLYLKGPYFYDCLTRVPLIIRWPGRFKSGIKVDSLVELVDLAPTLLEAAGIAVPAAMQGRSLVPLLTGQTTTHRDSVYMEFLNANAFYEPAPMLTGVRTGEWKLSLSENPRSGELYHFETDPDEFTNLWINSHYKDVQEQMLQLLVSRMIGITDPLPVRNTPW